MKLYQLTNKMNDHGTRPRIKVLRHMEDCALVVYEGHPDNADKSVKEATVSSFTVLGTGYLKIYTK